MRKTIENKRPHESRSAKYRFADSEALIGILSQNGWEPKTFDEARVKDPKDEGFQRHVVTFEHRELPVLGGGDRVTLTMLNAHNGTSSLRLALGIFRLVCSNGLVSGETWAGFKVRHQGPDFYTKVDQGLQNLGNATTRLVRQVEALKQTHLTYFEERQLTKACLQERLKRVDDLEAVPNVLRAQRVEDQSNTAWAVLNKIQEYCVRGGFPYSRQTEKGSQVRHARPIGMQAQEMNAFVWNETIKLLAA